VIRKDKQVIGRTKPAPAAAGAPLRSRA